MTAAPEARSLEATLALIEAFVARERGALREPLTPDTELLRLGLLDSMQLARLGRELAGAFGVTPPRGALTVEDFETPRRLWQCFQRFG
ncbi:MAG TPA: acyl carrier protein [Polyangiaceae bacterium]|nr:acyl carrier protein [Polyangiaceae bacterium]